MSAPKFGKWITDVAGRSTVDVARHTLSVRLAAVQAYLPPAALRADEDIEYVHELRVSTRRARAALHLYEDLLPQAHATWIDKQLKRVRRAAGPARDFDVFIIRARDADPTGDLVRVLDARRSAAQPDIITIYEKLTDGDRFAQRCAAALDELRFPGPRWIGRLDPPFEESAHAALAYHVDLFFDAHPKHLEDLEELHAFRIRSKQLRYIVELVADAFDEALHTEVYGLIEALQDRLGELNDHVSACAHLQQWIFDADDPVGEAELEAQLVAERVLREASHLAFIQWWTAERRDELRDRLAEFCTDVPASQPAIETAVEDAPVPVRDPACTSMVEVERKFRLAELPPSELMVGGKTIEQRYVFADRGELRVRLKGERCIVTVKGDGEVARQEWEAKDVPRWAHDLLASHTVGRPVTKVRYEIPHGDLTLEVDVYADHLQGLLTMECEFESVEASGRFELPDWASGAVDVTSDARFKNKNLALVGLDDL